MKPAAFRYLRPTSVDEALAALAEHGDEGKVLAGGQSLVPAMNFRLAYPGVLVDVTRIPELSVVEADDAWLRIGAAVTQRGLERSEKVSQVPAVAAALPWVGHLQTRNRGTVAGSLAHADPAAELPAVAVAVGAEIDIRSAAGGRTVTAAEFFLGPFTTDLAPGELVTAVRFPIAPGSLGVCDEVVRRHGDFAIAGISMSGSLADGVLADVRICAFGIGGAPQRLTAAEEVVGGSAPGPGTAARAGEAAAAEIEEPWSDIHGSGEFRRGAVGALVARSIAAIGTPA